MSSSRASSRFKRPRTADALNGVTADNTSSKENGVGARHEKENGAGARHQESVWMASSALVAIGLYIVVSTCTTPEQSYAIHAPSLPVWLELGGAIAIGMALTVLLAAVSWHPKQPVAVIVLGGLLLVVPYTLPFQTGIAASSVALLNFIGVWKSLDILAGTSPPALKSSGFLSFACHFASPVEYLLDLRSAVAARYGLWRSELCELAQTAAALALTVSVHGALSTRADAPPLSTLAADAGREALALYAEVWILYLFLRLLTGSFSTLLALCGFTPRTMFRAPLLASTSVSDFWGRRWNLLIHGLFRRTIFSPLTRRGVPARAAGALAFAVSGLFHEYGARHTGLEPQPSNPPTQSATHTCGHRLGQPSPCSSRRCATA